MPTTRRLVLSSRPAARIWAVLTVVASSLGVADELPRAEAYAFIGPQVILEPGKVLDNAVVVTRRGVIEAVGVGLPRPADALEIDAKGLVLHAGWIDAGAQVALPKPSADEEATDTPTGALAASVDASAREGYHRKLHASTKAADSLKIDDAAQEKWRYLGFTGRLLEPSGGILAGQSALVALAGASPRSALLRESVWQHLAFTSDSSGYPVTLMGMMAHLRQTMSDAVHHERLWQAYRAKGEQGAPPPVDPLLESLAPMIAGKQRLAIAADDEEEVLRAIAIAEELNVPIAIVGGREAYRQANRLRDKQIPVVYRIKLPAEPRLDASKKDESKEEKDEEETPPPRARREQHRRWSERIRGLRQLDESGVQVALSTEGLKPEEFDKSLRLLRARSGLGWDRIVAMLTVRPAKLFGVDGRMGSVQPGRLAHLVARTGAVGDAESTTRYVLIGDRLFEREAPKKAARAKGGFGGTVPASAKKAAPASKAKKDDAKKDEAVAEKKAEAAPEKPKEEPEVATEIDADRRPRERTGGNVLFRNANILTVGPQGDLRGADLLVRDGKIARLGKNIEAPAGVRVIDATGRTIMPGVIDSHSHMAIANGINEFTMSVTPECRVRDVVKGTDKALYRALAGGVTAARLLHGSANTIGGQDAVIKLRYGKPGPELIIDEAPRGVKFALGENVKRTIGRFPNSRLGVEAALIRAFSEAKRYREERELERKKGKAGDAPLRRDFRLEALADVLSGDLAVHCHCYRSDEILMLLRVADKFGVKIRSLQHALEGYKVAPEIAAHGASVSTFSDWWAYKWEAYDATPFNAPLLRSAGVDACLKSDSSELVRHMNQEAAKMIRYGFTPRAALEAITLIPARQLRLDARMGSIEPGKDADLAIFQGHPLNTYSRCVMTLVDGEIYFAERPMIKELAGAKPAYELYAPKKRAVPLKTPVSNDGVYAITGATIYPVDRPQVQNATLVIREGRIAELGADVTAPSDATLVDAKGLRVYPGFIDAGTKVGLAEVDSARETIDFREGGDFQPDLRAATAIHPDSEVIPVTRAGGILSVVTMPAGGIVAGQSALVNLAGWVPREMVLLDPLALHVRLPMKPRFNIRPDPFSGRGRATANRAKRIDELKSLFRLARLDQSRRQETARRGQPVAAADPRLEALAPYLSKDKPVVFHADSAKDITEALDLAKELGVRPMICGGRDAWKVAAKLKEADIPVIVGPVLAEVDAEHDPYDSPYACPALLHRAGVRFCIQSDDTSNSRNLPFHAAMAVAYGLPREEGLKAITEYPARLLGAEKELGTLTVGKRANLQIVDGDPLQASTAIVGLFIGGQPIEPTSKHTRLADRYAQRIAETKRASSTPAKPEVLPDPPAGDSR